ncbi:MAG: hypothetical protein SVP26_09225 [Chloroflexota bacterium]|nr:hypothetical protein [Chloroflexota bacterium]
MRVSRVVLLLFLGILLLSSWGCVVDQSPPATPTPEATPTPLATASMNCSQAKVAIQAAIDAYSAKYGAWPTGNGTAADIEWSKLVPEFMGAVPGNDSKCDWQVNSNPEGEVCVVHHC